MYLPEFTLHEPRTLQETAAVLERLGPSAKVMAGGTDLLVDLKTGRVGAEHVVSISGLSDLKGVRLGGHGLRIGALTTIADLHLSPLVVGRYAAIRDATGQMAAAQIRNRATVGGNIASAVPCADLPPILMVLGASVVLWSSEGSRALALDSFFLAPRRTPLRNGELLTEIAVPAPPPGFGAAYARFALRNGNAIAVAAVAAGLEIGPEGTITAARIALGAVAPIPKLVAHAGEVLLGRRLDDGLDDAAEAAIAAAAPISDVRGSASYRRELIGVLTRRALLAAQARALEGAV